MSTITFTVEGPSNTTGGELTFTPRRAFTDTATGDILTPGKSRRTVEYMCNTEASVDLPDGPWEVGGIEHNVRFPIDVTAAALLKDLIVFGLPTTAPVTTLAQAADLWLAANVNTEVSQTLITEALTDPESEPRQVLDGTYAPLALVEDTIHYDGSGQVDYSISGGIRTDYTWNADGTCHTETSQGLVKTWTYDAAGNPISSTVTEA